MDKDETRQLAKQIKQDMPDFKVIGVLRFGDTDFGLEVHDPHRKEKLVILNQKDWIVQMLKSKKAGGKA
jgi:hypothetical protein